ncbi:MAG: hypothetical protein MI861_12465, partial [Pirellulales bacterium]|nr:hypothetical protein [Pirellulales bacterium]
MTSRKYPAPWYRRPSITRWWSDLFLATCWLGATCLLGGCGQAEPENEQARLEVDAAPVEQERSEQEWSGQEPAEPTEPTAPADAEPTTAEPLLAAGETSDDNSDISEVNAEPPDSESAPEESEAGQDLEASQDVVETEVGDQQDPVPLLEAPSPRDPNSMRMLLPTTVGTLVVDVDLQIGDQTLAEAYHHRVDQVLAEAAGDDSDQPNWQQLFDHVQENPRQFGRSQPINPNQTKGMIRRYDVNQNKKPDHDEAAKFIFRSAGFSGPFRLRGTDHYRYQNRSDSKLFKLIDTNGDSLLDAEELQQAPQTLWKVDRNSNRSVDLAEALAVPERNDPAWNRRRSHRRGEVAMDLQGYIDWTMVSYSLEVEQGKTPLGIENHAAGTLDRDGDDTISAEEAKTLTEIPADLKLRVQFAEGGGEPVIMTLPTRPELEWLADRSERTDLVVIGADDFQLVFQVIDSPRNPNQIPAEVFAMLDANNDGGLDETEIPDGAPEEFSLEELDEDQDGKLSLREINQGSRRQESIWTVQVRARAAEFPDAVFAWLDR